MPTRWPALVATLALLLAPAHAVHAAEPSEVHVRTGAQVTALIPGGSARVSYILGGVARGSGVSDRLVCVTIATASGRDHGCADAATMATDPLLNNGTLSATIGTASGATITARLTLHGFGPYIVEEPFTLTLGPGSAALRMIAKALRSATVWGEVTSSAVGGGSVLPGSSGVLFHGGGALLSSAQPETTRESVSTAGLQGIGMSYRAGISLDGRYVAFESTAPNLVAGDTNGGNDVFVRDRLAGVTLRASIGAGGSQAPYGVQAAISGDGRYVAFWALLDGFGGFFVHDVAMRHTTLAAVTDAEGVPRMSGDGRYLAYVAHGGSTVRRLDRVLSTAMDVAACVSCGRSTGVALSTDGRRVAWTSSGEYGPGDTNRVHDVFVRDLPDGPVHRVSVSPTGAEANGTSGPPALTPDGRFVAFASSASNLVDGDTNGAPDVFVRDLLTGVTTLVSVAASGTRPGVGPLVVEAPSISADGRMVAFSASSALVPEDVNGLRDVYVRDVVSQVTARASVAAIGAEPDGESTRPALTADGTAVSFDSAASNLVLPDLNGLLGGAGSDAYVRFGAWGNT